MIIQTKEFKDVANTILAAISSDKNVANVEIIAKDKAISLNATNKEWFVSVKYNLTEDINFRAVVNANTFLGLVTGITADAFEVEATEQDLTIKVGKSSYKIPLIYDNDKLMTLPVIKLVNDTVNMNISNDILMSILNVNSKEIQKTKGIDPAKIDELQKLYYLDENGCFTFTTGACVNSFKLEKPIKLLLSDRIVRLFKLFKTDVNFMYGTDALSNGFLQSKAVFYNDTTYLAAIVNSDDVMLRKIQGPINLIKQFMADSYQNRVIVSATELSNAINRIITFNKNCNKELNTFEIKGLCTFSGDDMVIADETGNVEYVKTNTGSIIDGSYAMKLNLNDLKFILDSCKNEAITLNCGNHRSVMLVRGDITNVIPEQLK